MVSGATVVIMKTLLVSAAVVIAVYVTLRLIVENNSSVTAEFPEGWLLRTFRISLSDGMGVSIAKTGDVHQLPPLDTSARRPSWSC